MIKNKSSYTFNNSIMSVVMLCIIVSTGCKHNTESWENIVQSNKKNGWNYYETLGTSGEAIFLASMSSKTSSTAKAGWIENGLSKEKTYQQDRHIYLGLLFKKHDGDTFVIVMRREKTNQTPTRQP